jgi:hypothetical protein
MECACLQIDSEELLFEQIRQRRLPLLLGPPFRASAVTNLFRQHALQHSYASHSLKHIFNVHELDLLAVAKSFGFTVPPKVRLLQFVFSALFISLKMVYRCTWLWSPRGAAGAIALVRR